MTKFSKLLIPILFFTAINIAGCKKFLDEQPISETPEIVLFGNPNSALQAVLGAYAPMAGNDGYGARLSLAFPFDTDEMVGNLNGATAEDQRRLSAYDVVPSNSYLAATFNNLYIGVQRANVCIANIPAMPAYNNGSDADKLILKRLYGEALTLRAFYYSELIKIWGDVPAVYDPASALSNFDVPKTDRDMIYDKILNDLLTAEDLVPWRTQAGSSTDERISKGAVKGLRARIALFRGGYALRRESRQMERRSDYLKYYTIARDECADIMASGYHALNNSFQAIWQDYVLANKIEPNEVLFEVAMAGNASGSDSQLGTWNGIKLTVGTTTSGQNRNFIVPSLFYKYSSYDKRRDVSIAPFNVSNGVFVGSSLIAAADGKWRTNWITPTITQLRQYYGINWVIMRYSDVLLMYAEAINEINGGPSAEAIGAVNQVRRRAWATGALKTITVNNGGTGYTTAPIVTFAGGGGSGATAVATVTSGRVTGIDIISGGAGYTSTPTISFSGGGGSGATAATALTSVADADLSAAQTSSKDAFFSAIQDERLFEFVGEGLRKYDLIRWNLLGTRIAETKAELAKMLNKTSPYDVYPQRMFYKTNATDLVWGNSFYKPSPSSITGYTAINWLASITQATVLDKFAANFTPNKSELYPIATSVLEASHGVITQDYGY